MCCWHSYDSLRFTWSKGLHLKTKKLGDLVHETDRADGGGHLPASKA